LEVIAKKLGGAKYPSYLDGINKKIKRYENI